jgi:TM2 domain-containing membrane protein YozV/ribosomal protein L12E/L44/L45/RPP1/RPP2
VSQEWYYSVDGGRQGPISAAELKKLADAATIKPGDLVWKDGMADWVEAKSIKGLFGAKNGDAAAAQPQAAAASADERPSSRIRPRDDDDRPRRRRDEDDEEDRPGSRRRDEDQDDEERPARRRRDEDEEDDDRPRRRRSRVPEDTSSKKMVAGLLGILLGGWGIHKFYLGMTTAGIIQIVITFVTCGIGGIIGLIEGIIYLTKSDEDFHQIYVVDQKQWF